MSDRQFCTRCGNPIAQETPFCGSCGAARGQTSEKRASAQPAAPDAVAKLAAIQLEEKRQQRSAALAVFGFFITVVATALLAAVGGAGLLLFGALIAAALFIGSLVPRLKPNFAASYTDKTSGEKVSLLWWVRSFFFFLSLFSFVGYGIESTPSAPPPFYQPGPPADLLTMLSRGDTSNQPFEGLDAAATAAQDLCKVLVEDYTQKTYMDPPLTSTYKYGSTADDKNAQALVESEAQLLVTQLRGQFTDKKTGQPISDKAAEALLHDEAKTYGRDQQDPVYACLKIMPGLAQFAAH